jgi:hypothetical protein
MAILPATGTAITMGRVKKGHSNVAPGAGQNIAMRGTLASYIGVSSGAHSLGQLFGGRVTPYADT